MDRFGLISLTLNDREQALDAFQRAHELAPHSVAAYRGLVQAAAVNPDTAIARRMEELSQVRYCSSKTCRCCTTASLRSIELAGENDRFIHRVFAANALQRTPCRDGRAEYESILDQLE